jgi:hypothetical protein
MNSLLPRCEFRKSRAAERNPDGLGPCATTRRARDNPGVRTPTVRCAHGADTLPIAGIQPALSEVRLLVLGAATISMALARRVSRVGTVSTRRDVERRTEGSDAALENGVLNAFRRVFL